MFKRILIGYDGSEPAERAFDYACRFAKQYGASLEVLWVVRSQVAGDIVELTALLEEGTGQAEQSLRRLRFRASAEGARLEFRPHVGQPADQILRRAGELGADVVVLGHHPMSRVERWFNRSTARSVMERAPCPVLIVP